MKADPDNSKQRRQAWWKSGRVLLEVLPILLFLVLYFVRADRIWRQPWTINVPGAAVSVARFAPDGRHLELFSMPQSEEARYYSDKPPKTEELEYRCDVRTHRLVSYRRIDSYRQVRAYSPDHTLLATGGPDGQLRLWQAGTGEQVRKMQAQSEVLSLAFSPDGRSLACGTRGTIQVWDTAAGELRLTKRLGHAVDALVYSPDGRWLVGSGHNTSLLSVWDASGEHLIKSLVMSDNTDAGAVVITPDSRQLLYADGYKSAIKRWDIRTRQPLPDLTTGSSESFNALAVDTSGKKLAASSYAGAVCLWDMQTGRLLRSFAAPAKLPELALPGTVAFSPAGELLAANRGDGTVSVWRVR